MLQVQAGSSLFSRAVGSQNTEERACSELGVPVRVQPTTRLEQCWEPSLCLCQGVWRWLCLSMCPRMQR